jgi:hypothetical protein
MYALLALITAFLTPLVQHWALVLLRRQGGDDLDIAQLALFFGGFTALLLFGVLINVFDSYLWRTRVGRWLFRIAGLSAPPDLGGEYRGTIEVQSAGDAQRMIRTGYFMRIAQTWEQISLLVERESETGGWVRVHSEMANIRVGMMSGVTTLQFVYTFEENMARREAVGTVARHFPGTATCEFRRDGDAWLVAGHFFDDIGRSGQIRLRQVSAGAGNTTAALPPATAASGEPPAEPAAAAEPARDDAS